MNENKIPYWTNGESDFNDKPKLNDRIGSEELPTDILIHKIAIDGALLRQDILSDELSKVRRSLALEERNTKELMRILMKIPGGWSEEIPKEPLDWEYTEFDLQDAEEWIDWAVSELDKIAKTEVKDLKELEKYNDDLKLQVDALTRVVTDQKNNIDDIMTTLAEQVSLINEQKQIIKAAQDREDETVALKVQLDSMKNLCEKYAKENQKLKKAKK